MYWNSYIVVTIDRPRPRHRRTPNHPNPALEILGRNFINLINSLKKQHSFSRNNVNVPHVRIFRQNKLEYADFNEDLRHTANNFRGNLPKHWQYCDTISNNRALQRANNVLFLLHELRLKTNDSFHDSDKNNAQGVIGAFICFLAIFRQPRTIPMLRSVIDRWALRNIQGKKPNEQSSDQAHDVILNLLNLIAPKNNKDEECVKQNNEQQHDIDGYIGNKLNSVFKDWMPVISQRHEGGSIWLYREIHEGTYDSLTENLHTQDWIDAWKDCHVDCPKNISREAAIIDGMICISWHLFAARTYYVDIFMPTKDIKSFYEYLYHRVTAIRTISLLIAIIETCNENEWFFC